MSENIDAGAGGAGQNKMRNWAIGAGVLLLVFLLGLVPMWWQYRTANQAHEATQKLLRKAGVKDHLMTAIAEARGGEYETARQNASDFFTNLNAEIEKGDSGYLTAEQREKLKPIFANRDSMITLLAQRDPASVDRLADIYTIYKQALPPAAK